MCNNYKFLGIIISNDLKWNEHIDYISKKASKRLYFLRNYILEKVGVNREGILKVYYLTTIRPILEYGVQVCKIFLNFFEISWSPFKKRHYILSIHAIVT